MVAGLALVYLAVAGGGFAWGLRWSEAALGLVVMPGAMLAVGLAAGRYATRPLRYTGPTAIVLNCLAIALLLLNPYTGGGAELFYGTSLLVGAWRRQPDCEATVLSNWILGRDDQIGCPVFTPIDAVEARLTRPGPRAGTTRAGDDNFETVTIDFLGALRRGHFAAAADLIDPAVRWHGLDEELACAAPDDVVDAFRRALDARREIDALEFTRAGDRVVMGARGPAVDELAGEPLDGQIFNVFTLRDGRIVRIDDYRCRAEALAAAGVARDAGWR